MNKAGQRVRLDVAMDAAEEILAALSPAPAASGSPTQVRCAGCGTPSATSTFSPRPLTAHS